MYLSGFCGVVQPAEQSSDSTVEHVTFFEKLSLDRAVIKVSISRIKHDVEYGADVYDVVSSNVSAASSVC